MFRAFGAQPGQFVGKKETVKKIVSTFYQSVINILNNKEV